MTEDLVKRLRAAKESGDPWDAWHLAIQAADRIEKDAQHIDEMYGLVAAMNADHLISKTRIERLEAALKEIAADYETEWSTSTFTNMMDVAKILSERINIARKALEGKDE